MLYLADDILISSGFTGTHQIRGDLYANLETREFIVRNFAYDGAAPVVFFYVYLGDAPVDRFGGGVTIGGRLIGSYGRGGTVRRTIPNEVNIADIHTFTIWCERFFQIFARVSIPTGLLAVSCINYITLININVELFEE